MNGKWNSEYGLKEKFTVDTSGTTIPSTGEKIDDVYQNVDGKTIYNPKKKRTPSTRIITLCCQRMEYALKLNAFTIYNINDKQRIMVESRDSDTFAFSIKICPFCGTKLSEEL